MANGLAKTSRFMLGTASVMLGPPATMFDFTPAANGIGLVKNFKTSMEPGYVELTQGVKNTVVYSVMNKNAVTASFEAYEYTLQNLNFALGLDGSAIVTTGLATTTTASVAAGIAVIPCASVTGLAVNDYIMIQYGTDDQVLIRQVLSIAALNVTTTRVTPAGLTIPSGAVVKKFGTVSVGKKVEQPYLAAMVVGNLAGGEEAMIMIPKCRVTKGLDLNFTSDNYGNLPFELTIYDQVPGDPHYAQFGGDQSRVLVLP